ncbi:hypothetical protein [Flagellimonas sp. CMM7]|nr:hypothetical protein [Flagellimonas sp. CMM7]UII78790.1 hypothetical protein LV704_14100 [Flagellimonas sp. CMM7]
MEVIKNKIYCCLTLVEFKITNETENWEKLSHKRPFFEPVNEKLIPLP